MKYKRVVILSCCTLLLLLAGCSSLNKIGDHMSAEVAEKTGDKYYDQQNYSAAFSQYQEAARLGGEYGQFMLATMYLEGKGTERDYEKYVAWMSTSASNNYTAANFIMGHEKIHSDPAAAAEYFKRAADDEHGGAMFALGLMYATGRGVAQSDYEALRWFRLAKSQNFPVPLELLNESTIVGYIGQEQKKIVTQQNTGTGSWGIEYSQNVIVAIIQKELVRLGYKPGVADGIYGKKTQTAIMAFQKDHGLKVDGAANKDLLQTLKTVQ